MAKVKEQSLTADLLTLREAARRLGKRFGFVAAEVEAGRLAHYVIGGRRLISPSDLSRYLESLRVPTKQEQRERRHRPALKVRGKMSSCFDHLEKAGR